MDEFDRSEKAEWLRARPAEEARQELRNQLARARDGLNGAADKSTDPAVRAAYERVRTLEETLALLSE